MPKDKDRAVAMVSRSVLLRSAAVATETDLKNWMDGEDVDLDDVLALTKKAHDHLADLRRLLQKELTS
jgi:purine nucleoside phosphorylase